MEIRTACMDDLPEIREVYAYARRFMAENGNPNQWKNSNPPEETVIRNIEDKKFYLCMDGDRIAGVFFFDIADDPTYSVIEDGAWVKDGPYGVVHRIASAEGTKGVGTFCLNWAFERCGNLRIDTHHDNKPMQNLLAKLGFERCGIIYLMNGEPRIAYQKVICEVQ